MSRVLLRKKWQLSWPDYMQRNKDYQCRNKSKLHNVLGKNNSSQVSVVSGWRIVTLFCLASQCIVIPGDGAVCLCMLLPCLCASIGHSELILFCG